MSVPMQKRVCLEVRGGQLSCSVSLCFVSLRQCLSLNLKPVNFQLGSMANSTRVTGVHSHSCISCGCWEFKSHLPTEQSPNLISLSIIKDRSQSYTSYTENFSPVESTNIQGFRDGLFTRECWKHEPGTRAVAQLLKCLLTKHKDPRFTPSTP